MEEVRAHVKKSGVAIGRYLRLRKTALTKKHVSVNKNKLTDFKQTIVQDEEKDNVSPGTKFPHPHYLNFPAELESRKSFKEFKIPKNDLLLDSRKPPTAFEVSKKRFQRKIFVDPKSGEGTMTVEGLNTPVLKIAPGTTVGRVEYTHHADFRDVHMPNSLFSASLFRETDFRGACLDGSRFGSGFDEVGKKKDRASRRMFNVKFDGASLRNTEFEIINFTQTSFRGADLTGAKFVSSTAGVNIAAGDIDLTDSNVTPEQVSQIIGIHTTDLDKGFFRKVSEEGIRYREYSFKEACKSLGLTEKQFEFLVLSDVLEVRDASFKRIKKDFNTEQHHVPQWAIQNFLATSLPSA